MKALMTSYIEAAWSQEVEPSLDGFVKFCMESNNPTLTSLFLSVLIFMFPALVKRLGLRLHRPDIADGGSALGKTKYNLAILVYVTVIYNSCDD